MIRRTIATLSESQGHSRRIAALRLPAVASFTLAYSGLIYQPKTLAEVKRLKSGLHQGGLECLLRYLLGQEDERLRDREYKLLASAIEYWIEFIWESDDTERVEALRKGGVVTTGQFIRWLNENCYAVESSLQTVIERLQQLTP